MKYRSAAAYGFCFWVGLVASAWLATGCSFKRSEPTEAMENSPIELYAFEAVSSIPERDPDWGLLTARRYTLKACFIDRISREPLVGANVRVHLPAGSIEAVPSDSSGCIFWDERIAFSYLSDEHFVEQKRTFVGDGLRLEARFALDPWIEGGDAWIDLQKTKETILSLISADRAEDALLGRGEFESVLVENVVVASPQGGLRTRKVIGTQRHETFLFSFQPKLLRVGLNENPVHTDVIQGKFRVRCSIGEYSKSGERRSVVDDFSLILESKSGQFRAEREIEFPNARDRDSIWFLEYTIDAVAPLSGAKTTRGAIAFDSTLALTGAPLASAPNASPMAPANIPVPTPAFVLEELSIKRIDSRADARWNGHQQVSVQAKLVDPFTGESVSDKRFRVQLSDAADIAPSIGKPSRADGKIDWQDQFVFPIAGEVKDLTKFVVVASDDPTLGAVTLTHRIHLNPWATDEARFFRNSDFAGEPAVLGQGAGSPPKLEVADLRIENTENHQNRIVPDRHLQVTETRTFHMSLTPKLRRGPVFSPSSLPSELPEGAELKIRLWVSAPLKKGDSVTDISKHFFIGAFDATRRVNDRGRIEFDMPLMTDLSLQPLLESRVQITILISAVGAEQAPQSGLGLIRSFSTLPNGTDHQNLALDPWPKDGGAVETIAAEFEAILLTGKMSQVNIAGDHAWSRPPTLAATQSPLDVYLGQIRAEFGAVDVFGVGDHRPAGWPAAAETLGEDGTWEKLLDPSLQWDDAREARLVLVRKVLQPFCDAQSPALKGCSENPERFFVVTRASMIDEVDTAAPIDSWTRRDVEQVGLTYFDERLQTTRYLRGEKSAAGRETKTGGQVGLTYIGTGPSGGFNLKAEHEAYWTQEIGVTKDARIRASAMHGVTLYGDQRNIDFTASTWSCLFVRPREIPGAVRSNSSQGRAVICKWLDKARIAESWHSLRDRNTGTGTAMADPRSMRDRGWSKIIRGEKRFQDFKTRVEAAETVMRFRRIEPYSEGADSLIEKHLPPTPETLAALNPDDGYAPGVFELEDFVPRSQWEEGELKKRIASCKNVRGEALEIQELALFQAYCDCLYGKASEAWTMEQYRQISRSSSWPSTSGFRDVCIEHATKLNDGGANG